MPYLFVVQFNRFEIEFVQLIVTTHESIIPLVDLCVSYFSGNIFVYRGGEKWPVLFIDINI